MLNVDSLYYDLGCDKSVAIITQGNKVRIEIMEDVIYVDRDEMLETLEEIYNMIKEN